MKTGREGRYAGEWPYSWCSRSDRWIAFGCSGLAGMGSVFVNSVSHGFMCECVTSDKLHSCRLWSVDTKHSFESS